MRTFPTAFADELARKTGITPIWVLRLVVDGVTYDLSDSVVVFPVGMAGGFTSTLPWVGQWGQVREAISGSLGEMQISDFSCTVLVDQDHADNIRHLALTHPLEQSPATLYLWLDGLTSATPPQALLVGYVKDIDIPDETQVHLTIEDESTRLQKYIGTRISSEAYPLCDPDVVGKVIPIVYGQVDKLPALCVDSGWVSSIMADLTDTATSVQVSEIPAYPLPGKTIIIDDEEMWVQWGGDAATRRNQCSGATALASSYYPTLLPSNAINGSRTAYPDWASAATNMEPWQDLLVNLPSGSLVDEINVFMLQDNPAAPVTPTLALTGSLHVIGHIQIWYTPDNWANSAMLADVTGNTHIWVQHLMDPLYMTGFFVRFYPEAGKYSRCSQVEAWGTATPDSQRTLHLTRGYNGTLKQLHTKGAVVMEKKATPLVYLCADHALDSIGTVLARVRGVNVDITPDCSKYLGSGASQLAAYPGQAAITIPDYAKVSQRISLALEGAVGTIDPIHGHASSASTSTAFGPQIGAGTSESLHSVNIVFTPQENANKAYKEYVAASVYFSDPGGTILSASMVLTLSAAYGFSNWSPFLSVTMYIRIGGYRVSAVYALNTFSGWVIPITGYDQGALLGHTAELVIAAQGWGGQTSYNIVVQATISAATRSGTYLPRGVSVQSSYSGVKATNGTLALSGNSVADIMIGDQILVDCTRNITTPAAVMGNLLATYCGDNTLTQVGTLPAGYAFNGAITEYKKAIEWLDYLAFQCRAYYRKMAGVSRLIVREVNPASDGTIAACCLTDEGIKALGYKKAPISDVINRVRVLYARDWSDSGKQAEAYRQSIGSSDDTSIAVYGEQEQPDLFMFDFITGTTMASDLAAFYLAFYANRKWRVSFSTFLDQAGFEFGDIALLAFADNLTGTIVEAGIAPGNSGQIDRLHFVAEAAIIAVPGANDMTTLAGEALHYKNGEVITYA